MALNASAIAQARNVRQDPSVEPAYTNPNFFPLPFPQLPDARPEEPSFPVFVDPHGWINASAAPTTTKIWVAGATGLIPRRTVSFVGVNTTAAYRWFASLDDIYFDKDGTPRITVPSPPAPTPGFDRDYSYTYAFLCQRPRTAEPGVTTLAIVVYRKRAMSTSDLYEFAYGVGVPGTQVTYDTTRNVVTVTHGGSPPKVRAGDWIMDATRSVGGRVARHAFFYRVLSATDLSNTATEYELQTPLRDFGAPGNYPGALIVMEGVIEVFERGTGSR